MEARVGLLPVALDATRTRPLQRIADRRRRQPSRRQPIGRQRVQTVVDRRGLDHMAGIYRLIARARGAGQFRIWFGSPYHGLVPSGT